MEDDKYETKAPENHSPEQNKDKKPYKKPTITTEVIEEANATSMGGGGSTCNGGSGGGRKDSAASGCTTLLT